MPNFVNVRPNTKDPFIVNADDVSIIIHRYLDKSASTPKPTLSFHDHSLGRQIWMDQNDFKLDMGTALDALKTAGTELLALPLIREDMGEYAMAYINPKSFLTLITSQTYKAGGDKPEDQEECVNILLDIAGYGRLESDALPVKTLDAFMKGVTAVKPNLMTVLPETAKARFVRAGYTTFDPTKVTTIRPNGYDMDVGLQDGVVAGSRIDFMLNDDMTRLSQSNTNYANKLWHRAEKMKVKGLEDPVAREPILHEIFARADKRAAVERGRVKNELADAIIKANPNLLKIENSKQLYCVAPAEISTLHCHETRISVQLRCPQREYSDTLTIGFETEALAQKEAMRLLSAMNGGPSADINKPALNLKNIQKRLQQNPKAP